MITHILNQGQAFCLFTRALPGDWPEENNWISLDYYKKTLDTLPSSYTICKDCVADVTASEGSQHLDEAFSDRDNSAGHALPPAPPEHPERPTANMTDEQYRAFLDLMMVSDPWPLDDENTHQTLLELADVEARARDYPNWIEAYHLHMRKSPREDKPSTDTIRSTTSNVQRIDYDNENSEMIVTFASGAQYKYLNVPRSLFNHLNEARSLGKAFSQRVKGYYRYTRI